MEIIYKTFDGKEFNNEEQCLDYEEDCADYELKVKTENFIKNNHLAFFDEKGNHLNISIFEALNKAAFISISTEDSFEIVEKVSENYGLTSPLEQGLWEWDEDSDDWVNVDDKMEELAKTLRLYHEIKSKIANKEED